MLVTVGEAVSIDAGMSLVVNIAVGVLAEGGVGVSVLVGVSVKVFVSFWVNLNVAVVVSPAGTIGSLANTPSMCGIEITNIIQTTPRAIPKTLNFNIRHSPIVPINPLRNIE